MKEENRSFIDLLKDYKAGIPLTEDERRLFFACLDDPENIRLLELFISEDLLNADPDRVDEKQKAASLESLYKRLAIPFEGHQETTPIHKLLKRKIGWAAIFIIAICSVAILVLSRKEQSLTAKNQIGHVIKKSLITPGKNGAVLMLADGSQIVLDSMQNGVINVAGNGQAVLANGRLNYKALQVNGNNAAVAYNTISTPLGRQYQVQLSDGTKVWLNAASSIKFPTVFSGKERMVEISGEAYFEVVHNSKMPFKVKASNQIIEDIGTHFDIKAYSDDPLVKTTLIEGAVSVSAGTQRVTLKPGEQASAASGNIDIKKVDVNEVMAWKSGFFAFDNANLDDIMRQLSRWYNVSIEYHNTENTQRFTGKIDRSLPLADVLNGLQFSKAHFKINENERKIIVLP